MRLLFLLFPLVAATPLEHFRQNGIVYDLYGQGRLIQGDEQCRPWTMNIFAYVDMFNTKEMTEYGRAILKRRLFESFAKICQTFQIETDVTQLSEMTPSDEQLSLRFMDRFELAWNVLKFERDLKSLFLEHKINTPFLFLVNEPELRLFQLPSKEEFAQMTTIFPNMCNLTELSLETKVCTKVNNPSMSGNIYAIAHSGMFVNHEEAYVYYDVPKYVIIDKDRVAAVDVSKCKVIFGTYIYCFTTIPTKCNTTSLDGCQLMGVKSNMDAFYLARQFGTGQIVATKMKEADVLGNGTMINVPSNQFSLRLSYRSSVEGHVIDEVRMMPVQNENPATPFILGETLHVLGEKPIALYKVVRKGQVYFSHKMPRPTVWDGVRDFFLHLV
ncbi:unnamed protein product [Auanema sp. JU1783]|nr:unnamed protein product [Auanema sp. JU1783]